MSRYGLFWTGSIVTANGPGPNGTIVNGRVLVPGDDDVRPATVAWRDGVITAIEPPGDTSSETTGLVIDADEALVLPGIIDVHGDAFERCLMPRGGVAVDLSIALADNDRQLMAAGITTSFLSATDSWEPGLRSRQTLRALVAALAARQQSTKTAGPDIRLHVRHERCNIDDFDELLGWINDGSIDMLSYNDHTGTSVSHTQVSRSGLSRDNMMAALRSAAATRPVGMEQEKTLATAARQANCVTASHDAATTDDMERDLNLGVAIAEFPTSVALAKEYQGRDLIVLLGAPNLVRGGSHLGNLSVGDALAEGACDMLCSDYHYPSLLMAPFVAADSGTCSFGQAWEMVSTVPAQASGLTDRGQIEVGARADLLAVKPPDNGAAQVRHAIVNGSLVSSTVAS